MSTPFVSSAEEAAAEIRAFNQNVGDYAETLSQARAWYVTLEGSQYLLGPSKIIGHRGMTSTFYYKHNADLDGRATESALKPLSAPIQSGSPLHQELLRELSDLCAKHGAKPNKLVRFATIGFNFPGASASKSASGDDFVQVMAGAYLRMSTKDQKEFRRLTDL